MPRTLQSPKHRALKGLLIDARKAADLTQTEVARRVGRYQSYIAAIEIGQRRVDVVEFLGLCEAIGCDPREIIDALSPTRRRPARR